MVVASKILALRLEFFMAWGEQGVKVGLYYDTHRAWRGRVSVAELGMAFIVLVHGGRNQSWLMIPLVNN